ncbi:DUF6798 domain-containing protein [Pleurocapsa sp. PCC 7319]|uniref:DUF6798 domain-containing protein n=1 Tax=Pleurocapsa sp. PCC 7319 TaxID=118161 RepID=UPI000344C3B8|nr:DUF6798 domain-containing protein [Pleurocapsa sp. PCC 7319]
MTSRNYNLFFGSQIWWQVLLVTLFIAFRLVLVRNMGSGGWNEIDVLPLAKHFVDPSWLPNDWYLDRPAGYRWLFQTLVGKLIVHWGFLATSIIGRLFCYALSALGIVLLGKRLGLSLPFILLATALFCGIEEGYKQGAIADEWMIGGLEAKAIAYGLILIAIPLLFSRLYFWVAFLLGVATSFHVLVGGWAFLTSFAWLCLRYESRFPKFKQVILLAITYILASSFAILPVIQQLSESAPDRIIKPSYIYVFLRLSHHLNPLSWGWQWLAPAIYLVILAGIMYLLNKQAHTRQWLPIDNHRQELGEFALISLVPFISGVAIAIWDTQGQWLQYYPFRLGDVMLPFTTCFLGVCLIEHGWSNKYQGLKSAYCVALLFVAIGFQSIVFTQQIWDLRNFPGQQQDVTPEWKAMATWIHQHTPQDAAIISSPVEQTNFSWLTERSTIAKFKLLPQTKAAIIEQYQRWDDLSGNYVLGKYVASGKVSKQKTKEVLEEGYSKLTTAQVKRLMNKYGASYILTKNKHQLNLEVVYRHPPFVLYGNSIIN